MYTQELGSVCFAASGIFYALQISNSLRGAKRTPAGKLLAFLRIGVFAAGEPEAEPVNDGVLDGYYLTGILSEVGGVRVGFRIIALEQHRLLRKESSLAILWTPSIVNDGKNGTWGLGWPIFARPKHTSYMPFARVGLRPVSHR